MGLFRVLVRWFAVRRRSQVASPIDEPFRPLKFEPRAQTRVVVVAAPAAPLSPPKETVLQGRCWVIDGDTIVIGDVHIRIAGIDAPELDHPWGQRSKWALVQLCKGQTVTARIRPELSYDRLVAECFLPDGRDIAAELVSSGLALDWPKFSGGKYRHLEPADARRKLWRADARQRGMLRPTNTKQSMPE
jgi:endonuclease YncB( thermonuclease family)